MSEMKLKTEKELNMVRGKLMVNAATREEVREFLKYVVAIEGLLDEADLNDVFGTEGWRHRLGIDSQPRGGRMSENRLPENALDRLKERNQALKKQNAALLKAAKSAKQHLTPPDFSNPIIGEVSDHEIIQQLEQAIAKAKGEKE